MCGKQSQIRLIYPALLYMRGISQTAHTTQAYNHVHL